MHREGITLGPGQRLGCSTSPRILINDGRQKYNMEPDGVIFFERAKGRACIPQTNDSLLEKARKWIFDAKCKIVGQMRRRWLSPKIYGFAPLKFNGHTWLDEISEGTDAIMNMKYISLAVPSDSDRNGSDKSSSVPRSVGDMRLAELIPLESPGSSDAADVIIDFSLTPTLNNLV
ncbi:hypothetical protein V1517DRAFT_353138 [Lipomyces orientalis]|uniref:Uncharacterized protein n=1 Tax=Lipomyces orientalis TaxID=1233043 RepID=A0ACC3TN23_9ASCO